MHKIFLISLTALIVLWINSGCTATSDEPVNPVKPAETVETVEAVEAIEVVEAVEIDKFRRLRGQEA